MRSADWNRRLFFHVFSPPLSPSPVIRCSTFDLTKIAFESLHQNLMAWKRTGRDGFVRKKQNSHFDHFPLFHPGLKKLHKKSSGSFPHAIFPCLFILTKLPLFESQKPTFEGVSVNKSMVWLIAFVDKSAFSLVWCWYFCELIIMWGWESIRWIAGVLEDHLSLCLHR